MGVGNDIEQLFVGPDIRFERRDIEIAHHNHLPVGRTRHPPPLGQFVDEAELVREFVVHLRVGNIAAGGHVHAMDFRAVGGRRRDVPAILLVAGMPDFARLQRNAGDDGDAIIALHAVDMAVSIAMRRERRVREKLIRRLGLLQAHYIRIMFVQQPERERQAASPRFPVAGILPPWR
jgi:hypothetical protein